MQELQHYGIPGMRWGHRKDKVRTPSGIVGKKKQPKSGSVDEGGFGGKQNRNPLGKKMSDIKTSKKTSLGKKVAFGTLKTLGIAAVTSAAVYGATLYTGEKFVEWWEGALGDRF